MLEGIRHYPKRKRKKSKSLILAILPIVLIMYGFWYIYEKFTPNTSRSTTFVIKPKIVEEINGSTPEIVEGSLDEPIIQSSKGLDEVIENYEASTYNQ